LRHRQLVVTLALFGSIACGGSRGDAASPSPLAPAEAIKPAVEITYPQAGGDPIPPGDVLVALTVRSFDIVDQIGAKPKDGEGHLVYYLDVDDIPTEAGASALVRGAGRSNASAMTSHTWRDVGAGPRTLGVQLVNNDDTPLDPPVTDEIEIVVGS
jgi:hypothetical protein